MVAFRPEADIQAGVLLAKFKGLLTAMSDFSGSAIAWISAYTERRKKTIERICESMKCSPVR